MGIGAMRFRIQLQSKAETSDGGGGATIAWTKIADMYADIKPVSAKESAFGRDNQLRQVIRHKITTRYRRGVIAADRIIYNYIEDGVSGTRTFNIRGVLNIDNRSKYIEFDCEEGVPT